jgi:hypothetical protein
MQHIIFSFFSRKFCNVFYAITIRKKTPTESIKKFEKSKLPIAHKWVDGIKIGL